MTQLLYVSASISGGVITSLNQDGNGVTTIYTADSTYLSNTAVSAGCVFHVENPHIIHSEANLYDGNAGPKAEGAFLAVFYTGTRIIMQSDRVYNSVIKEATLYSRTLESLYVYNTTFINNTATRNAPGILIQHSVVDFRCIGSVFTGNGAEFEGILGIKKGDSILIDSTSVSNNIANFGLMVDIKQSGKITVIRSDFVDNYCSGVPCFLSVTQSEEIEIDSCSFSSSLISERFAQSINSAIDVDGKFVSISKSNFFEIEGIILKGLALDGMFLHNISNSCPENYYFQRAFTGVSPDIVENQDDQMSVLELGNGSSVGLHCTPCAENHYRIGVSIYSLETDIQNNDLLTSLNDVCHKCPPGGVCEDRTVIADVNHWGFVQGNKLDFVFCGAGHCCQEAPCPSYDTCNEGREGQLCTSCQEGYLLGLVNDNCALPEDCVEGQIYIAILVTGLIYIIILLVKVEFLNVSRMVYLKVITACNRRKGKMPLYNPSTNDRDVLSDKHIEMGPAEKGTGNLNENGSNLKVKALPPVAEPTGRSWFIPCDTVEIFHVVVFHVQDTGLFQVRFPGMPPPAFTLGEYKDKVVEFVRLDSMGFSNQQACIPEGRTQLSKLFIKISIIPFMVCVFVLSVLFIKGSRSGPQIKSRLMSSAYHVFLLILLFSSQTLSTSALNLVTCVDLATGSFLRIDTTVECYDIRQWVTFAYILLFIFPLWLALLIGSGLLRTGVISVRTFLIGMFFPGPFVLYSAVVIYRERKKEAKAHCLNITADAILRELYYSYKPFFSYRYLCWGGVVELRRLALVIFASLIPAPIARVMCMTLVVIIAFGVHAKFHPYSDGTANASANLSLAATVIVGMINFGWATLLYAGSGFEYGIAWTIGKGLATLETALAELVPLGIIVFCCLQTIWVNLVPKTYKEPIGHGNGKGLPPQYV